MLQKERSGKASILKYGLLLPSFLCFIFLSSASISSMGPSQGNATFKAPEFPGGLPKFKEFLSASLKYSDEGLKNNISGRVILSFVVNKSGYITNIEVIKSLGYGLDEAAVSALEDSPKWQPGMENGRPVNTRYDMPVLFQRKK